MLLRSQLRRLPTIAAACALAVLSFAPMASADPQDANLGPVGPHEPILATFGDKRVIAYYEPSGGKCVVSAVVFDKSEAGGGHASSRVRVALHPGDLFHVEGVADQTVVLACGPNAGLLTVLNRGEVLTKSARVN